ncbi:hypothetical protein [Flavisolibacter ginsenosidimutans]|uniref:Aromatic hydrocarbon degradation protein n=1 Tax=Flavisolibacter ginsenosidimutans TaxID=661481 RepID=A0A5B8UKW9_9BACT|nr:hypothetical protein [Flavisolibacter ginsenosidimutans]QEC57337.1 hypothetical protein FSB75_15995 [Flavisolibacter ginsenosidimutans]
MQLANTTLHQHKFFYLSALLFSFTVSSVRAQDNSPYSRYGLGNLYPQTNVINRGMGGVAAAYSDVTSVNYTNPASYAAFQVFTEQHSGKVAQGRVILDAGVNINSRSLTEPNTTQGFTSSEILFSHVYVGIPIRKNWGLAFGIRPITRIAYDISQNGRLYNSTGGNIDSVNTQYTGTGGSFLPTIGTGFGSDHFRVGVNVGYLFGRKEISTHRVFMNDSIQYAASDHTTNTSFGNLFFNAGLQYQADLSKTSILRVGASGNWKQTLKGSQDVLRQTYTRNSVGEELRIDSVFQQSDITGDIIFPASYTAGFMLDNAPGEKTRGWSVGLDYNTTQWNDYRFFGAKDLVQNSWELRAGAQLTPSRSASRYGQFINYRFGVFSGQDYINADKKLPVLGFSFGMGLPLPNYSRLSGQVSMINLGLEYVRRGNNDNKIKENLFRLSIGLNFTDMWFGKRRYD